MAELPNPQETGIPCPLCELPIPTRIEYVPINDTHLEVRIIVNQDAFRAHLLNDHKAAPRD